MVMQHKRHKREAREDEGTDATLTPKQARQHLQILRIENLADRIAEIAMFECAETPVYIRRAYKKMQGFITKLGAEIAKL